MQACNKNLKSKDNKIEINLQRQQNTKQRIVCREFFIGGALSRYKLVEARALPY